MNKSDSERIAAVLEGIRYEKASNIDEANLILVNMCSVRQSAVDRVFGLVRKFKELKKENKNLKTLLTGCVSSSDLKKFRNFFDFVLSIKALSLWPEFLNEGKHFYYPNPRSLFEAEYLKKKSKYSKNFSALISISTGCDNFCSFCIVPYVRGPLICRPHEDVLKEAKFAIETGSKEIWLLGQNVNSYRSQIDANLPRISRIKNKEISDICGQIRENSRDVNFPKLLRQVNDIEGNFWIRFTSSHPKPSTRAKLGAGLVPHRNKVSGARDFSWDELIDTMAECKKVTEYLNLPVQSGDDEILKKMNRPYTIEEYKKIVKKIREKMPEIALSTDVIVGFPSETKKQFQNTVALFKEIKYDMAYIAKYSPRPGTTASKLKDDIKPEEKERRWRILTRILKETALEKNKKYIGKEIEVLVDKGKNNFYFGKTRTYKTVKVQSAINNQQLTIKPGQFVKAKIIDALPWGLKGILR